MCGLPFDGTIYFGFSSSEMGTGFGRGRNRYVIRATPSSQTHTTKLRVSQPRPLSVRNWTGEPYAIDVVLIHPPVPSWIRSFLHFSNLCILVVYVCCSGLQFPHVFLVHLCNINHTCVRFNNTCSYIYTIMYNSVIRTCSGVSKTQRQRCRLFVLHYHISHQDVTILTLQMTSK